MAATKVFINGGSQAVRLPKECRYDPDQSLVIKKIGDMVIMVPEDKVNELFGAAFGDASEDFFANGRNQGEIEERTTL